MANYPLTKEEKETIDLIYETTIKENEDNISRTVFYNQFFHSHKEIIWACLASFVSRNAGWNMTDLEGETFSKLIPKGYREILFLTYERANWLIFSDACPQLLLYEASKQQEKPLFHLLKFFGVSRFMEEEWNTFWLKKDVMRLCTALIINEQHVIQKPVIEDPFYSNKVFKNIPFVIEDRLHFSTVLFPTLKGKLYGYSVHGFTSVKNRIDLGKRLTWLLFESEEKERIQAFAANVEHTGSRYDYEKFIKKVEKPRTPRLKDVFPIIKHHRKDYTDWFNSRNAQKINKYFKNPKKIMKYDLTDWYYKKQKQLTFAAVIEQKLLAFIKVKFD